MDDSVIVLSSSDDEVILLGTPKKPKLDSSDLQIVEDDFNSDSDDNELNAMNIKTVNPKLSPIKKPCRLKHCDQYLHNDKMLPIYCSPAKLLSTKQCFNVLLDANIDNLSICLKVPCYVNRTSVFVVDIGALGNPRDITCDDMGAWQWKGSYRSWCCITVDGDVEVIGKTLENESNKRCYRIWKRYYEHKCHEDVKKLVVLLEDDEYDTLNLAIVQYVFMSGNRDLSLPPHGNSHHDDPYMRTMPSVMKKLKAIGVDSKPKQALAEVCREGGGIVGATSAGAIPRNRQQVKDVRRKLNMTEYKGRDTDPLYTLMMMCKDNEGKKHGQTFVQIVNAAPFPMMVLAFDYMLDDLSRFCTSPFQCSILGIDPTFSLGSFDVTVTTYRHLMLRHKDDPCKSPVMIGPLLIHLKKTFETYHFFASSLVSKCRSLVNLQAFGTDGETALSDAFSAVFPNATHLRCFLHFRGNIEEKLRQLNVPKDISMKFIYDILGKPSTLESGLVDAESEEELDAMIISLEDVWNHREEPFHFPPEFYSWFVKNCHDTVAKNMLRCVRENVGLGSPPQPYYTNDVESKNNILKQKLQYKKSELPRFVSKMQDLLLEQKNEIERAVACSGEYRVCSEYTHLTAAPQKWFKMTEQQRMQKVKKFMSPSVYPLAKRNRDETDSGEDREGSPICSIGLPPDMSSIIWSRAKDLVAEGSALVRCPGDNTAWMVKSQSGKRPHYIKAAKNGGYLCDETCISFKSSKLCAHVVAVAIKCNEVDELIKWYKSLKCKPNLTLVAEDSKPSSSGKKPSSKRKASTKKATQQIRKVLNTVDESSFRTRIPLCGNDKAETTSLVHRKNQLLQTVRTQQPSGGVDVIPSTTTSPSTVVSVGGSNAAIAIGNVHTSIGSPPPLLPMMTNTSLSGSGAAVIHSPVCFAVEARPPVNSPFWICFVKGNVSRCNGCKGKIGRTADKKPLPPPEDIVLRHREYIVYRNSRTGLFEQSKDERNVYYHAHKTCVLPNFIGFDATEHIKVDSDVIAEFTDTHYQHIASEFGVTFV